MKLCSIIGEYWLITYERKIWSIIWSISASYVYVYTLCNLSSIQNLVATAISLKAVQNLEGHVSDRVLTAPKLLIIF